jgi:ribosomal protein L13E
MEETKEKISAIVKAPCRDAHIRKGRGFSLGEIKEAGKTVVFLKELDVIIDYFRKTIYSQNVEMLKTLKEIKKKTKKRKPFTPKEKKTKPKPFKMKKKMMPTKVKKPPVKAPVTKEPPAKKAPVKKTKVKATSKIPKEETPLTKLSGMGPATAKKFQEIGVTNIKQLLEEDPKELAMLVKGASEERIIKWCEEAKKMLK